MDVMETLSFKKGLKQESKEHNWLPKKYLVKIVKDHLRENKSYYK